MNDIDTTTLYYFTNKSQYDNIIEKQSNINKNTHLTDKKFYKKRIINITKELFKNNIVDKHLQNNFDNYVKSCINYIKFIDKKDIIQEKYNDMSNDDLTIDDISKNKLTLEQLNINNNRISEINEDYISSNTTTKHINLDNFVITKQGKPNIKILPQKEIINLKTKELKTKGLKTKGLNKKKNIPNIYEDEKK